MAYKIKNRIPRTCIVKVAREYIFYLFRTFVSFYLQNVPACKLQSQSDNGISAFTLRAIMKAKL